MDTLEILEKAYDVIVDPRSWSKDGGHVRQGRYCATQALDRAYRNGHASDLVVAEKFLNAISREEFKDVSTIVGVNDGHGHWAVCRVYRIAIKRLRARMADAL